MYDNMKKVWQREINNIFRQYAILSTSYNNNNLKNVQELVQEQ